MKNRDIYIGTIKKCNSLYCYKKYGEKAYIGDFRINNTEIGQMYDFVDVISDQAILIKVTDNKYIWLNKIQSFGDELRVNLGISPKTISTYPSNDKDLFVDTKTLIPYFENEKDESLNVNKLRKKVLIDPRIKMGIEH